ncbi:hypothetical protein DRQ18_00115 [bacterium]|nr:MAG: hypothetical protein DRQ18_00115 [bacterium]
MNREMLSFGVYVLSNPFRNERDEYLPIPFPDEVEKWVLSEKGKKRDVVLLALLFHYAWEGNEKKWKRLLERTRGDGVYREVKEMVRARMEMVAKKREYDGKLPDIGINDVLRKVMEFRKALDEIKGVSTAIREVKAKVWEANFMNIHAWRRRPGVDDLRDFWRGWMAGNVVVLGERGTGKELVVKAIAAGSVLFPGKFSTINCSHLKNEDALADLFGAKEGAYTGLNYNRMGIVAECNFGIIFLDEVADLEERVQRMLLRTIERGEYCRMGEKEKVRKVLLRLISATNKGLDSLTGDFRDRIRSLEIKIPPLRERKEDIEPILIEKYEGEKNLREKLHRVLEETEGYPWPGNVRELDACFSHYLSTGRIELWEEGWREKKMERKELKERGIRVLIEEGYTMEDIQRLVCRTAVEVYGKRKVAAEKLGISLPTLRKYLNEST